MKEETDDMKLTLIAKYLSNELNNEEKDVFAQWMSASEENRKELENAKKIWQNSNVQAADVFNTDHGWNKMKHRIHGNPQILQPEKKTISMWMKVAASLILLIGVAFAIQKMAYTKSYTKVIAENQKMINPLVLPDGSKVFLNAGSSLKYPKSFDSKTRLVELTGEAFFEVTHNQNCPFVIQTIKARIKVLGTSFNVSAYAETDSVQVVVETGTVELSSKTDNDLIRLTRGNTGVYYTKSNKLSKSEKSDANAISWKTNVIVFHDADLTYVTKTLKKVFSQQITIDSENLKKCRLNADFKNQDLEHILEAIKTTLNLDVTKTNNGYIINGPGC
jgi:ferric-dicitrate binding protein FerR (iron transport regulator)